MDNWLNHLKWFMNAKKLPKWGLILIFVIAFHIIAKWSVPALSSWLSSLGLNGFLNFSIGLILHIVVINEIIGKFIFFRMLKPPIYEPTKVEDWPHFNLDALTYYTNELQSLGFTSLGDYTTSAIRGMIRTFSHSELNCFADVGQLAEQQIFCLISSELESDWAIAVTNIESTPTSRASSYAFTRLPRTIHRTISNATPTALLQALLNRRSQMIKDLSIQPLKDVSIEMHFCRTRERFFKIRNRLLRSSISWRMLMYLFYKLIFKLKPPSD
jgi:hypothetical protein